MPPDISEFSFGFALTHEMCTRWTGALRVAPVFPSLIDEGSKGGGYDLSLNPGFPLFIQFKVSQHMERRSAGQWNCFGAPYYRFWIYSARHSKQHMMLLE